MNDLFCFNEEIFSFFFLHFYYTGHAGKKGLTATYSSVYLLYKTCKRFLYIIVSGEVKKNENHIKSKSKISNFFLEE